MLLKLDENLGRTHVDLLQKAGHAADRVYDQGLSGWSDSALWKRICDEGRFFITSIWILPTFAGTSPDPILESFCCVPEAGVVLQFFTFWNES